MSVQESYTSETTVAYIFTTTNNNNSFVDPIMKNTISKNTILENKLRYRASKKIHQGLSKLDDLSLEL